MRKSKKLIASLLFLTLNHASFSSAVELPQFKDIARGSVSDDSIYFVMTDRFANGKFENDEAYVGGGLLGNGYDPSDPGYFHGGDFVGLTKKLPYIKSMGFTSIWITPPVVQNWTQLGSGAYHGYWGTDFTTIDPHFGTEEEFKQFVRSAHELDLKVIVDIVINHTADIIKSAIGFYSYVETKDMPYLDSKGRPFDFLKHIGKRTFPTLDPKKSFPRPPFLSTHYKNIKKPAWLNDVTNYHNRGDSTFSGESSLYGDFFGLDDLFTEKPEVIKGMISLWSSWIEKFNIDGYRIDTAKHVNPEFWREFLPAIEKAARTAGKKEFPIFGEVYETSPYTLSSFVAEQKFPSVLDFAFQNEGKSFVRSGGMAYRMVDLFNADDAYTTARTSAYGLPTFLGNHDMGRTGYFIESFSQDDPELVLRRSKLANALLFFSRGAPVIYYGDEKGMAGNGGDKSARQDMFETKVLDWQTESRIGSSSIGVRSAFDETHPLQLQIAEISKIIGDNPALRDGTQQVRAYKGGILVMSRFKDKQEYVVAFNSDESEKTIDYEVSTDSNWEPIYGDFKKVTVEGRKMSLQMSPVSFVVLKAESKFAPKTKLSVKLNKPATDYNTPNNWLGLTATVPGDDFVRVNFQIKVAGKDKWINLGTADRRTFPTDEVAGNLYRGYFNQLNFRRGTKIQIVAIAKGNNEETVYSKILNYTIQY